MKCVEEGHVYSLNNTQTSQVQEVTFMKRTNGEVNNPNQSEIG